MCGMGVMYICMGCMYVVYCKYVCMYECMYVCYICNECMYECCDM